MLTMLIPLGSWSVMFASVASALFTFVIAMVYEKVFPSPTSLTLASFVMFRFGPFIWVVALSFKLLEFSWSVEVVTLALFVTSFRLSVGILTVTVKDLFEPASISPKLQFCKDEPQLIESLT